MDERDELVEKYRAMADQRGGEYVSRDEFLREYKLTIADILRAGLDGFTGLVLAAGGKVSTSKQVYSDDDLVDDVMAVASRVGKLPTQDQYEAFGRFSSSNLKKRFGSWSKAMTVAGHRLSGSPVPPPASATGLRGRDSRPEPADNDPIQYVQRANDELDRFSMESRAGVDMMSSHYAKLYCLERQMRTTIADTLKDQAGDSWWESCVPQDIRDNATKNVKAEERLGVTPRSERLIDYTTLGELGVIVDANWKTFARVFKNQEAMKRIMRDLNMLRAYVAHCTPLPPDEVTRLGLNISDWIRQLR